MANAVAAVVPAEVSHDVRPVVLKTSIDDVHECGAVALIAQGNRIAALPFANAQKVDLEVGCHY